MPTMRTILGAIREFKAADPDCAITEHFLRQLVKQGKIKYCRAGAKYLLDMAALERYLIGEEQVVDEPGQYGQLRKIF